MRHSHWKFLAGTLLFFIFPGLIDSSLKADDHLLVEAESFSDRGGWVLDTQFISEMGSPYLLAHGLGKKVKDAETVVKFPSTGKYRVFVRTKDWVARWNAKGTPGRFKIGINGNTLETTFGTTGRDWHWQKGGVVEIRQLQSTIKLIDLTGFDGRCDAIYFLKERTDNRSEAIAPPNSGPRLAAWRFDVLGLPLTPEVKSGYDLVVVGGGYSGMASAISAARMGCKVALIQNRPVLGGNGSSEVRVWAMGNIRRGKYPRIGEIVDEFQDHATKSPGTYEEFGDAKKEKAIREEKNIELFLNHHAFKVSTEKNRITGIFAFDTRTSRQTEFRGRNFVDCTGHGTIGFLAGANWEMTPKERMGMSNMWRWAEEKHPASFPVTDWALDLNMKDFPYPRDFHGQWFWESGFDKDPLQDAEGIRDWNLRAVFGAFNAMKNRDGKDKHLNAILTWVAFIGGPRESRRILGDVVLTQEDIVNKRDFPDGFVPSTWSIDLHYPKKQYLKKYPDNPFISIAKHDRRIDRTFGYPVPYRCFYSRNINNLFMAGRCISVTHEALGTTRVMKTCGMMGEVVGKAASICALKDCSPREVYEKHLDDLKELLQLPGKAYRKTVTSEIVMPKSIPTASPYGPPTGIPAKSLNGLIVDDRQAKVAGHWTPGTGLKGYIEYGYQYANPDSGATMEFPIKLQKSGKYEVRIGYLSHENRGASVPVTVYSGTTNKTHRIDMRKKAPIKGGFISLGLFEFDSTQKNGIRIGTEKAAGIVHADAIQLIHQK